MWNQKTIPLVENKNSFILGNMNNILLEKVLMGNRLGKYQALKYYLYFPREKKLNFKCHRMLIIFFYLMSHVSNWKIQRSEIFFPPSLLHFDFLPFQCKILFFSIFFFCQLVGRLKYLKIVAQRKRYYYLKKKIKLEGKTSRINAGSFRFSWIE